MADSIDCNTQGTLAICVRRISFCAVTELLKTHEQSRRQEIFSVERERVLASLRNDMYQQERSTADSDHNLREEAPSAHGRAQPAAYR